MKRRVPVTVLASLLLSASFLCVSTTPAAAVTFGANGRVVFASDRSGSMQVYSMRYGGDGVIQLTTVGSNFDPSYSGDGQKIAFISSRNGSNQLFTMAADGSAQTLVPVTPGTTPSHPSWAPNGSAIAFAGLKGNPPDSDIYSIKPTGTGLVDFTPDLTNFDNDPSWSPGGMTIAFDRTYATGGTDVWSVQQTGTGLKQLTRTGYDSHPSWSPDNKNLVFQSTRDSVTGP